MGFFRTEEPSAYVLLNINPLVNRMLKVKGISSVKTNEDIYHDVMQARKQCTALNPEESAVLSMVRNKDYRQLTVHLQDGRIVQADIEEELEKGRSSDLYRSLQKILREKVYQTVTVKVHDGGVVRIQRKTPVKFREGRQEEPESK